MQDDIMVSVVCIAYNHERFIRQALESFVVQKTNFKFEILVHDDASPDRTADIIREYEQKYPELIRAVYQTENQYSQGRTPRCFLAPMVRGKYVAFCEGDDYWTSPDKLQKQVDALEAHPEIDVCAHGADKTLNGKFFQTIAPSKVDTIIPIEKVIEEGGSMVATSSLMRRAEFYLVPAPFTKVAQFNDYTIQVYSSLRGGMLYLADRMSVYNCRTDGTSYSAACKKNKALNNKTYSQRREMLAALDAYTEGKLRRSIALYLEKLETAELLSEETRAAFKKIKSDCPNAFRRFPRGRRVYVTLGTFSPLLAKAFRGFCRVLRSAAGGKIG